MHSYLRLPAVTISLYIIAAGGVIAQGPPRDPERRAEMLRKFDSDGDGKLSPDELQAARSASSRPAHDSNRRKIAPASENELLHNSKMQELLARHDRDGDGKLNFEEMATLRAAMKSHDRFRAKGSTNEYPRP